MIFIAAKFTARPEHAETFLDQVGDFTRSTRAEPGNLWFEWSRSAEEENVFVLLEAFADGDAGAAHVNSDHFKAAGQSIPPLLTRTPDIVNAEVPGTEWSKLGELAVD